MKYSKEFINRLPRYYRYLCEYRQLGSGYISSRELAFKMGVTSSQIRNDMTKLTVSGQQGCGYNIDILIFEIAKILGLDTERKVILIGAGNIGKALINHRMFKENSFRLTGIFDVKEMPDIHGQPIRNISTLPSFVEETKPEIAIIAVTAPDANSVAQQLIALGIKSILNFSYTDLDCPDGVAVQNVHLRDHLMILSYMLNQ